MVITSSRELRASFYPCKPDIFEASYDAVTKDADQPSETERLRKAIDAIYSAKTYEGGQKENGVSLELIGAIFEAADVAGLLPFSIKALKMATEQTVASPVEAP